MDGMFDWSIPTSDLVFVLFAIVIGLAMYLVKGSEGSQTWSGFTMLSCKPGVSVTYDYLAESR